MSSKPLSTILCAWGNIDVFSGLIKNQLFPNNPIHTLLALSFEEKVLKLVAGVKHAAIVTENVHHGTQSISLFGLNTSGQLGRPMDPEKPSGINKWTLPAGSKVIDLALGRQHTLILVQEPYSIRSLWGAGSNHFGQLLSPHLGRSVVSLHRLYSSCDVLKVAVGMDHSVLLHENGTVSTAGWSSDGQCGRGHQEEQFNFNQSMEAFWDDTLVVDISAGADHSLALTESGQVYAWGNSEYGQCCNGEKVPQLSVPKRVAHQAGWIQSIRTCASSTLLQNRKKEWWYYGMENAQGIRLPLNDMLSKGGNTFLSTSHHNFLNIQADAIFKGKSKFQLDMKLPRAPLMVASGFQFTLGLFPCFNNMMIDK